jgi:hypothetical protein
MMFLVEQAWWFYEVRGWPGCQATHACCTRAG